MAPFCHSGGWLASSHAGSTDIFQAVELDATWLATHQVIHVQRYGSGIYTETSLIPCSSSSHDSSTLRFATPSSLQYHILIPVSHPHSSTPSSLQYPILTPVSHPHSSIPSSLQYPILTPVSHIHSSTLNSPWHPTFIPAP